MQPEAPLSAIDKLYEAQDRRDKARETSDVDAHILAARDCGLGHFELNQLRFAELLFGEARSLIEESGRHRELLPDLIGMIGRTLQRMKWGREALDHYRLAAQEAEAQHLSLERLKWMGKEARTRLDLKDVERGLPLLEQAVTFARSLEPEDDPAVAAILAELTGRLANSLQDHDAKRAEALWEETFALLEPLPRGKDYVLAAINYTAFLTEHRKFFLSRTYLEEALELGQQLALSPDWLLDICLRMAALFRGMQDAERGGDYLLEALKSYLDPVRQSKLLSSAVDCFFEGNAWAKMKATCAQLGSLLSTTMQYPAGLSRETLWKMGATQEGLYDVEMKYSIACRGLGETGESLAALKNALEHAKAWGDLEAVRKARGQTAIMLVEHGAFAEASRLGEALWAEGSRDGLLTQTFVDALIGANELDRADEIRDAFADAGGSPLRVARMTAHLSDAGCGDPVAAWYEVGRAGERDPDVEAEALTRLIEHYPPRSEDRFEAARARLRLIDRARTQVADVFSEASWRSLTPLSSDFPSYLDAFVAAAIDVDRHEEAIYELERFRSQMLVNVLGERSARWARPENPPEAEASEGQEPGSGDPSRIVSFQHGTGFTAIMPGSAGKGGSIRDQFWLKNRLVIDAQRVRFRYEGLAAKGAGWRERREAAAEVDRQEGYAFGAGGIIHVASGHQGLYFPGNLLEHLHGADLADGEYLVFQHVLPDKTVFWAINKDRLINYTELPAFTREHVVRLQDTMWRTVPDSWRRGRARDPQSTATPPNYRHLGDEPDEGWTSLSEVLTELDQTLAQPLAAWFKQLEARQVFLVAGTDVTNLPLDCCEHLLAADVAISFLPTGRALGFTRSTRYPVPEIHFIVDPEERVRWAAETMAWARDRMLIVIDPTQTLRFAPLEAAVAEHEARNCAEQTLGPEGVDENEVRRASGWMGIMHLIGHGTFDDRSPYRSGMYLSHGRRDELWSIADIFSDVDAPAGRLAVLSGCETGRARPNLVSEEVSLPAALIAAGFASVLSSRWPVDDLSTTLLMSVFYRRWFGGGIGVGTALRESASWLRDLRKEEAAALVQGFPAQLEQTAPERAEVWRPVCVNAARTLAAGPEHPFRNPEYWAAFFVAGDGSITSDGADPRVPLV